MNNLIELKKLAGIAVMPNRMIVIKKSDIEEMRDLLGRLKNICNDNSKWNEVEIGGVTYVATGIFLS